ncbi:MAG: ABC transporter ATP-binding protein [Kiritimatiellia bacterium]
MKFAVEMNRVTVRRRGYVMLDNMSLCLPSGAFLAILGPNGAGKTTFLNIIPRLVAFEGSVRVLGRDLAKLNSPTMARLRSEIGFVPQLHTRPPSVVPLSVREVVEMGRAGKRGMGCRLTAEDRAICADALRQLQLEEIADRPFGLLSGGEQRKVHLARVIAQEPRVLLLDEPTAHLDLRWQEALTELIGEIWRARGITVLMVSHEPQHLPEGITHVALFSEGRLVGFGPPEELMDKELLASLYGVAIKALHRNGSRIILAETGK